MTVRAAISYVALGCLLAGAIWPAAAQDAEPPPPRPRWSSIINLDAMIDNYARLLARKYNLTDEQDAFTQQFLREKCGGFLEKHRTELFDLVDRMFEVRGGADITPQEMIDWGKRARPLFEQARALIVEGNSEWRGILTEEQRKMHDQDLKLMNDGFATTEDQLQRMVSGQMTVDEFRHGQPPRREASVGPAGPAQAATATPAPPSSASMPPSPTPQAAANPPPKPAGDDKARDDALARLNEIRKRAGQSEPAAQPGPPGQPGQSGQPNPPLGRRRPIAGGVRPAAGADFEGQWEAYVRDFVQRYKLDDEQQQRAHATLQECQNDARSYMSKRRSAMDELDKQIQTLTANKDKDKQKDKPAELAKLNDRKAKMLEPINAIFERRLKPRLEKLPTRAQRQAVEGAAKSGPANVPGKPGGPPPGKPNPPSPPPPPPPQPEPMPPPPPQPPPPEAPPAPE
jgi:hypothetical protein